MEATSFQTVQEAATEATRWFETAYRGDDRENPYTRLKDGRPEWIQELVYSAHGDFVPDDWRYETISYAVESIAEGSDDPGEFADDRADVYTGQRLAWLASNLNRAGYCDDAVEEFGYPGDLVSCVGLGQYMEASEVFGSVLASLEVQVTA